MQWLQENAVENLPENEGEASFRGAFPSNQEKLLLPGSFGPDCPLKSQDSKQSNLNVRAGEAGAA